MTEKRFINDIDDGQLIDTKGELSTIDYSDTVDFYELWEFLNKLNEENEQLKQQLKTKVIVNKQYEELQRLKKENEQLKHNNQILSMKMSEVYTKYCLLNEFSEDTNPNDAVKRVLSELMQITKEFR